MNVVRTVIAGMLLLAQAAGPGFAQEPQTQPTSRLSVADQQRLNDLLALIEGPNSPQVRQTGARELLRQGWPEAVKRLAALLGGSNPAAKIAVAAALADLPQYLHSTYLDPLLTMLGDAELDVRRAAITALSAHRNGEVIPRLQALLLDAKQPLPARLAAVETLGLMTQQEAIAALTKALADPDSPLAGPALAALEQASGMNFNQDAAKAREWGQASASLPPTEWQQRQIERLVAQCRETAGLLTTTEARLGKALRDCYLRTPEQERAALLQSYLTDPLRVARLLALDLVQAYVTERKPLPPEALPRVRDLLADPEPAVRAAAARTVAAFREPADGERFLQRLAAESQPDVRQALVNGLGYVGALPATESLLRLLERAESEALAAETITALGRLAERNVLDAAAREAVTTVLLAKFQQTRREQGALRERLLRAMGRLQDARCGAAFVEALDAAESPAARQAAIRGVAALGDARLAETLLPALSDADVVLRKAAVEAFAQLAASDAHLQALWGRLAASQEPDETVRQSAWRGVVRLLTGRPAGEIESWIARLPEEGPAKAQYALELLQLIEKNLASQSDARGELGRIRGAAAAQYAQLEQMDKALETYHKALEDLHAVRSPHCPRVGLDLLRLALLTDRYDESIATLLFKTAALNGKAVWDTLRGEIESRLAAARAATLQPPASAAAYNGPDGANGNRETPLKGLERTISLLAALQAHPPARWPPDVAESITQTLRQARDLQTTLETQQIKTAVGLLRENPADETARAAILQLGPRAALVLRQMLQTLVAAETPDATSERLLHDLLKTLLPEWAGFAPNAAPADKLKALEALKS